MGEPQSGHTGQGGKEDKVKELTENVERLQQSHEYDHAAMARLNSELQDAKSKRTEDYNWIIWEMRKEVTEATKNANNGKGDPGRNRSSRLLDP